MLINEIAQWAALAFIGIFVLGLTRQLGKFLVPPKQQLELDTGPAIGTRVADTLIADGGTQRVKELMQERGTSWAALVVVGESCVGCKPLLEQIEADGVPGNAPLVLVARSATPEYRDRLEQLADLVTVDADAVEAARLRATPFALVLDRSLHVAHKELAWSLTEIVRRWRNESGAVSDRGAPVQPQTTQIGGEQR